MLKSDNKNIYNSFIKEVYVPVFSMPWWLDAICGEDNWDVWIYKTNDEVIAALPYYEEKRGNYKYITKAPLTQNNGLIINYPKNQNNLSRVKLEERIINSLVDFLEQKQIDVYEQQFHHGFHNFLPFFWSGFEIIPRFTYVLNKSIGIDNLESTFSSNYRNKMRKGERSIKCFTSIDEDLFYKEHEKIFGRQGLPCPFSLNLWKRLFASCNNHDAGEILVAIGFDDAILSLAYLVSDDKTSYLLLGGEIPQYSSLQTFPRLVKECIIRTFAKGKSFDFEGSMIKRINHSFREYGGQAMEYYRIRKIYNKDVIMMEAQKKADFLK